MNNLLAGKNVLFFDLETTGLPITKRGESGRNQYYDHKDNTKYNEARIVSIGWLYIKNYDKKTVDVKQATEVIRKPEDFKEIKTTFIHGITYNQAVKDGVLFTDIMANTFGNALMECDYLVAHNCMFDAHILLNELYRNKCGIYEKKVVEMLDKNMVLCTGEYGKDICKMTMRSNKYTQYKMPKLKELYKYFYGVEPQLQHNAAADVITMALAAMKM